MRRRSKALKDDILKSPENKAVIVFATENENKMVEIREILKEAVGRVYSLKELGLKATAEENGSTFSENAEIKAREIAEKLKSDKRFEGMYPIVMADDSGLCIDFLGGAPGVYSARWLGHDTPYEEKNRVILEKLEGVEEKDRGAAFVCAICAVLPDGRALHTEGRMTGRIAYEAKGENGFGYDPIFFLPEYGKTSSEISGEEKNRISHRGRAIKEMARSLKEYL